MGITYDLNDVYTLLPKGVAELRKKLNEAWAETTCLLDSLPEGSVEYNLLMRMEGRLSGYSQLLASAVEATALRVVPVMFQDGTRVRISEGHLLCVEDAVQEYMEGLKTLKENSALSQAEFSKLPPRAREGKNRFISNLVLLAQARKMMLRVLVQGLEPLEGVNSYAYSLHQEAACRLAGTPDS